MRRGTPSWTLDPARRHQERTLALPPAGRLRLAVVADTHSRPHPDARALIRREAPDAILHAGDIGDLAVLDGLRDIAPVIAVRGNIDGLDGHDIPDGATIHLTQDGEAVLSVLLMHVAVRGPRLVAGARRLAGERGADLVICGHSHVPLLVRDGDFAVFNPGSIGPRRFDLPITFGVLDVGPEGLDARHVDCQTGERWLPPGAPL